MRDRDIRNAIVAALKATNAFDEGGVWITGLPEDSGEAASLQAAVGLEPMSTRREDLWDAASDGGVVFTGSVRITVMYRDNDIQLRDEGAEQLVAVVANAVNGNGFVGLVFPQTARIMGWDWLPASVPERRIATTFSYQYIVENWDNYDTTT